MENSCLYCYEPLGKESDFHEKCAVAFFGTKTAPRIAYSLNEMDVLAKEVVERSVAVPGVQPKLSMTVVKETGENIDTRLTVVGALGGNYIMKPPSNTFPEMPENEHLTMRMAEAFGLNVVPSSLIRLKSRELAYITKRIDRNDAGEKVHMIDMFQITEAFDKYKGSMEKVGKALDSYAANTLLDKTYFFDMAIFCFLTGNNDMHLKNFSMIEKESGWGLAPAYDLLNVAIVLAEDTEELALTMIGKKHKLTREDFEQFGTALGLSKKQVQAAFNRFFKNKPNAFKLIEQSFLSKDSKAVYRKVMEERCLQVGVI